MYMTSSNGALMSWYQKGNALVKEINLIITGSNLITILFSISYVYMKKLIKKLQKLCRGNMKNEGQKQI